MVSDEVTHIEITTPVLSAGGMPGFSLDFTGPLANGIEQMPAIPRTDLPPVGK
jgi:hypothetical protein